jgi:hypothetical protein
VCQVFRLVFGRLTGVDLPGHPWQEGAHAAPWASLFFGLLAFAWVFDGFNSFLMLVPSVSSLYTTQNWTRLVTGTGMGLAVSAILMPAFIQTMFRTWEDQSAFKDWKSILIIVLAAAGSGSGPAA